MDAKGNLLFRLEVSVSNDYNVDPLRPVATNQEAYYLDSRGLKEPEGSMPRNIDHSQHGSGFQSWTSN